VINGLSAAEAESRLQQFGPNAIPEEKPSRLVVFLKKFWGPVPWMLELSVILELLIGRHTQALVISLLLVFNAALGYVQENRAQEALALLQKRLAVSVRVRRDGEWQIVPSKEIVPGDLIHLRVGDFVPADVTLTDGLLSIDQSALTGEALPVELEAGKTAYTGSIVQRGEASGEVTATGVRTFYGKTAELVRVARTISHSETTILGIVRYLIAFDALLAAGVLVYAVANALPLTSSISFALMLLVASVPASLPTTFTLASALGAQELAAQGVLVTRLAGIEEAAAMDVLCSDKTGTITKNQLALAAVFPYAPYSEAEALRLAAIGCDESSQDPIDLAILAAARERKLTSGNVERLSFAPFDPQTKRTETLARLEGHAMRIVKGYPETVEALVANVHGLAKDVIALSKKGYRVIAVATGDTEMLEMLALMGFYDPPRVDSKNLIDSLKELSVRVVMVTGDGLTTARAIATQVGLGGSACTADESSQQIDENDLTCNVIAGVLPEDKFKIVQAFQKNRRVVGMTGDGVNDAPALKQAEVGIAVSNATDVARASASAVLTNPGLSGVLSVVKIGRQIHQRMLTYTFNKLIKTFQIALFLSAGLWLTSQFVTTPRLVVLLLFANDFVSMSLASDRVPYSRIPVRWQIRPLVASALALAAAWLLFSFGILYLGLDVYHLDLEELQTYIFVMLVFTGQANVYLVRERRAFWKSRPCAALLISTLGDVIAVTALAVFGILMAPISLGIIAVLLGLIILYAFVVDAFKVAVLRRMGFTE
jgi:H+-transporting ATPase